MRRYRKANFRIQSAPPFTPVARHRLALEVAALKPSVAKLYELPDNIHTRDSDNLMEKKNKCREFDTEQSASAIRKITVL